MARASSQLRALVFPDPGKQEHAPAANSEPMQTPEEQRRDEAIDTLLDRLEYNGDNFNDDLTERSSKFLARHWALQNAMDYLDPSDDLDRHLIEMAESHSRTYSAATNGREG